MLGPFCREYERAYRVIMLGPFCRAHDALICPLIVFVYLLAVVIMGAARYAEGSLPSEHTNFVGYT